MEKSVEGFCQDQHDCKDDSRTSKKRSVVASSKLGAARCTNRGKKLGTGEESDKSQQISPNPTQVSKLPPLPVMKRKIQKSAGSSPKAPLVYNLRSRDQKTEASKEPPAYNLRSKVRKTEPQNTDTVAQKRKTLKRDDSKDSSVAAIQKTEIQKASSLKSSESPVKKIGTTKLLSTTLDDNEKMNQPSSSQYEPFFHDPIYHIRWEGGDMENVPFGQNCIICNKDLSGAIEDDDDEDDDELNEDFQFEVDDDEDDEYGYYEDQMPPLLPAVDILSCGHAYHTECLQQEEQSSDPRCVLCSKK